MLRTRFSRFTTQCALATLIASPAIQPVSAAALFWNTNGAGSTLTAANWGASGSGPFTTAWTNSSDINFTANSSITNVTNIAVGNITISGGVLVSWTAAGTFSTGAGIRTVSIAAGGTLNWNSQGVSTSAGTGFIKSGDGLWNIGAQANLFPGGFTLNAGEISLGGNNALGNGALVLNGGTVSITKASAVVTPSSGITIGGSVTFGSQTTGVTANGFTSANAVGLGSGARTLATGNAMTVTLNGNITNTFGGLTLTATNGNAGLFVLGGANNSFTGGLTIAGGTTQINGLNGFGTGAVTVNNRATLVLGTLGTFNTSGITVNAGANLVIGGGGTLASAIAIPATGILTIATGTTIASLTAPIANTSLPSSNSTLGFGGGATVNSNSVITITGSNASGFGALDNFGGVNTFTGTIALSANAAIGSSAGSLNLTGPISDNGFAITKTGIGNLILGGSNSLSGGINILSGPTSASAVTASSGVAALIVTNTAALGSGTISFVGAVSNMAGLDFAAGAIVMTASNAIALPTNSFGLLRIFNDDNDQVTTLSGLISGGEVTSSTLDIGGGVGQTNSIFRFTNAGNTFSLKTLNMSRGTLGITSNAVLGNAASVLRFNEAKNDVGLRFDAAGINMTHDMTYNANAAILLRGDTDGDGITDTVNDATISGDIVGSVNSPSVFILGGTNIAGNSAGALTLTGNNTSNIILSIAADTKLVVGSVTALAATTGSTIINAGATLGFNTIGTYTNLERINLTGSGVQVNGTGVGAIQNISGAANIFNGRFL